MPDCLVVVSPFGDYAVGDVIFADLAAVQSANRNSVVMTNHPAPDAPPAVIEPAPEPIPEPAQPAAPAEEH